MKLIGAYSLNFSDVIIFLIFKMCFYAFWLKVFKSFGIRSNL